VDAFRTPLIDCFRQGDAPLDIRLAAARGGLALPPESQLALLMVLASDPDSDVAAAARATIARLPRAAVEALLAGPDVPAEIREFYRTAPGSNAAPAPESTDPVVLRSPVDDTPDAADGPAPGAAAGDTPADIEADPERRGAAQRLAMLTVAERMKAAVQGSREERSILVRDPNRLVSWAVLSSPKLTESEVEAIARMTNVSVDVLRVVGTSRVWLKNYAVVAALTRNAKTPIAVALHLLNRLTERDVKALSTDRNIPEPVRLAARKIYAHGAARRQ
jgi:hypothetical protein